MPLPSPRYRSLARRLSLGFVSVLALLLAVAVTGLYSIHLLGKQVDRIVHTDNRKTELANNLMGSISSLAIQARSVALFTELDPKQLDIEFKAAKTAEQQYLATEKELTALLATQDADSVERQLLSAISENGKKVFPAIDESMTSAMDGDNVGAVLALMNRVRPTEAVLRGKVNELIALQRAQTEAAYQQAATLEKRAFAIESLLVVIALVTGGLMAWRITVSVTAPIGRAVVLAERIATGDLSSQVEVRIFDETGRLLQAIDAMQEKLKSLVGGIRLAADAIQVSSSEVAAGNQDLSHRTEQAASNLQQTAQSMDELTSTVLQSSSAAVQANQLAGSAAQVAARGGAVVAEVVSTMGEINASSKKIADIISVIDGIAFQTNILALNAAVEAARAGEQGRGFAVVASEVRSLAGRSATAAREIKDLIGASVNRVERGSQLVADAGATMGEIVTSVQRVTDTISEITAAASAQNQGIGQINSAIAALDQMTQQNSALVEESAAAAESLNGHAMQLTAAVSTFKLDRLARLPA
ncbi:methyl-accepting chemotaxis protein [Rhodoferax koreense]|uniref:Methyl-accepting chemotaxis protein n=1 Tax=Rhodoferax koreensis TaxID=1842727 RepID=A0A1P8JRU4_9BURK|nr:methyl-accepting chemotaxis protein [Rhodoferax koreense]APW36459.1 methyl-accepting chemotaxis protein [Rhodoferax koreense]